MTIYAMSATFSCPNSQLSARAICIPDGDFGAQTASSRPARWQLSVGPRIICQGACKPGSVSRTVSDFRTVSPMAAIHLGHGLLRGSSNQPGQLGSKPACPGRIRGALPLFGLAPGGVCHADPVTSAPVRFYRTLSPLPVRFPSIGGILSVALSLSFGSKSLARRALPATLVSWSPDFPRPPTRSS